MLKFSTRSLSSTHLLSHAEDSLNLPRHSLADDPTRLVIVSIKYANARTDYGLHERAVRILRLPLISPGHLMVVGAGDPRIQKRKGFASTAGVAGATDADDCAHYFILKMEFCGWMESW